MMKLVHVILLTSQGIPFLHAGQDFARTKEGDPNSYQSPDHVNQIVWERKAEFYKLFSYTKALIELRKKKPSFRLRTSAEIREKLRFLNLKQKNMVGYVLKPQSGGGSLETMIVLFNANREAKRVKIPCGQWTIYLNSETISEQGSFKGSEVEVAAIGALILGGRELGYEEA